MTDQSQSHSDAAPIEVTASNPIRYSSGRAYRQASGGWRRVPEFDLPVADAVEEAREAAEASAAPAVEPEPEPDISASTAPDGTITPPLTPPHRGEEDSTDEEESDEAAEIAADEDDEEDDDDLAGWSPPPGLRKPRHDEWTRRKMVLFLRELAASQSVSQAAKSVGMSRQSAYRLRARMVGTPFAFGWEVALEAGLAQLAHAMLDRAVNGVEVPHYFRGEVVGSSRHFDERLSIWLMGNPWKVGRQQLAREYSAEGFDRLLERIELGPIDWGGEHAGRVDQLPGLLPPAKSAKKAGKRQDEFMGRSWYSAAAGDAGPGRGRGR